MIKILFVDDEANVLKGLQRMLHSMREQWEMTFAQSGTEALAAINATRFDIVVSDLRMPDIDGLTVLKTVRERSPDTVRIALSGHAERESTLRAVRQIHQFLSKPCDSDTLKTILSRAVRLGELLADDRLRKLSAQMTTLPSLSTIYDDVVKELEDTDPSLRNIGQAIEHDAGMSTKVLHLVNSAFFGMPHHVASPMQATILLGLETLRVLILSIRIFDQFEDEAPAGLSVSDVWEHSVSTARLAKRIALAESESEETAESAFLAGLLHDVGKLVFAANLPEKFRAVIRLGQGDPALSSSLEQRVIGATHGEVGAYLMGLWGFTDEIIEAIAWHHEPPRAHEHSEDHFSPLAAVHIANALLYEPCPQEESDESDNDLLDPDYLARFGFEERLPLWRAMCRQLSDKEDCS